jgi:hypothetical protein
VLKTFGRRCLILLLFFQASGCGATKPISLAPKIDNGFESGGTLFKGLQLERDLEDKILALNPVEISERAISEILPKAPAPRIILIHGGVPLVYLAMESFADFLIAMGYPEGRIRHPLDGSYSFTPYRNSEEIAGMVAWYYEREGMRPILIGHSLGGIQVVQVLYDLADAFADKIAVWNPLTEAAVGRYSIVDPIAGTERPVVGLQIGFATAVASGGLGRLLRWQMTHRLRSIPDTVEEFTGFSIGLDVIGGDFFGLWESPNDYQPSGVATVRNVWLPSRYNHLTVTATKHLAAHQEVRDWINDYRPGKSAEFSTELDVSNILWAADVWRSVKKHWCLEVQRLIRSERSSKLSGARRSGDVAAAVDKAFAFELSIVSRTGAALACDTCE